MSDRIGWASRTTSGAGPAGGSRGAGTPPGEASSASSSTETSLHRRAAQNLDYIRATMERSAGFTAVPGAGGVVMGLIGLAGGAAAFQVADPDRWLAVWLADAVLGFAVGAWGIYRKARRARLPLLGRGARGFALAVGPPVAVGAALTVGLVRVGAYALLPSTWLLLYGLGVLSAGMRSLSLIRWMGGAFLLLGVVALLAPPRLGDLFMAAGFGGLNVLFGVVIWRWHGG